MNFTDRGFEMMSNTGLLYRIFRRYIASYLIKFIFSNKNISRRLFKILSQLWINYRKSSLTLNLSVQKLRFSAGDLVPFIKVNGKSIIELLTLPKFYVILFGIKASAELNDFINEHMDVIEIITLEINDECITSGIKNNLALIIRPDQYIGLIADYIDEKILRDYFKTASVFSK